MRHLKPPCPVDGGPILTQERLDASFGRAASADRLMAVSQHQANTGLSIAVKNTTIISI